MRLSPVRHVVKLGIALGTAVAIGQCGEAPSTGQRTTTVSYWQEQGAESFPWVGFLDTTVRVDGFIREQRGFPFRPPDMDPPADGLPDLRAWRANPRAPRRIPKMYSWVIRALDSVLSANGPVKMKAPVLADSGSVQVYADTSYGYSGCDNARVWAMTAYFTGTSSTSKLIYSAKYGILAVCTELGTCFERRWSIVSQNGRDSLIIFRTCLDSIYKEERRRTDLVSLKRE
jgi:hypothetical protein